MKRIALIITLAVILTSGLATAEDPTIFEFQVVTVWTAKTSYGNYPLVVIDYPMPWQDVTGQPSENLWPDPNIYVVEAKAEELVLDNIDSDSDYLVLWSEEMVEEDFAPQTFSILAAPRQGKDKDGVPPPNEFGQIRSFLARNGVSQAEITEVVGVGAQGRSRGEIAGLLRGWMKGLPKGE